MNFYLLCAIAAAAAYLLGGINGAIILSRLVYHEDIRTKGSGNPGFTNFKRVHGFCPATFAAMGIDIFKTIIPVLTFRILFDVLYAAEDPAAATFGAVWTLLFCMLGHVFPVWYGFKGGKAVLCYISGIWFVDWRMGMICGTFFLIILFTVRYMSLASILFATASPIVLLILGHWFGELRDPKVLIVSVILSALVVVRHWENIKRLVKGTESKFSLSSKNKLDKH